MIQCGVCDKWQHVACFGICQESDIPEVHVCEQCAKVVNYNNK